MTLTQEQKDSIAQLAGLFYTPRQVAIIQELPMDWVMACMAVDSSEFFLAYWKGWYEAEVEFRREVKKLSNLGSSPAQTLLAKIIEDAKLKLIDR